MRETVCDGNRNERGKKKQSPIARCTSTDITISLRTRGNLKSCKMSSLKLKYASTQERFDKFFELPMRLYMYRTRFNLNRYVLKSLLLLLLSVFSYCFEIP